MYKKLNLDENPCIAYLQSNFVQRYVKRITREIYDAFAPEKIDDIALAGFQYAEKLSAEYLRAHVKPDRYILKKYPELPSERFEWKTYNVNELSTTLWVSDLPHKLLHQSLKEVIEFASDQKNKKDSPKFFNRIESISKLSVVSELPSLVVEPASGQRSDIIKNDHYIDENKPESPKCEIKDLFEGAAHTEDGHHRLIVRILKTGEQQIKVIKFCAS